MSPKGRSILVGVAVLFVTSCSGGRHAGPSARPPAAGGSASSGTPQVTPSTGTGASASLTNALTATVCRGNTKGEQCEVRDIRVSSVDPSYVWFDIALRYGPSGAPVGAAVIAHQTGAQWRIVWGPGTGAIGCFGTPMPAAVLAAWNLRCPTTPTG